MEDKFKKQEAGMTGEQERAEQETADGRKNVSAEEAEETKTGGIHIDGEETPEEAADGTDASEEADREDGTEPEEEQSAEAEKEATLEQAKRSLFSKKEKKEKKDKRDEKIEELTDRLMRQMAEFDNFRKRTEREKAQMFEIGARDVLEKILPVVDNFERGFAGLTEEEKETPFVQGMDKIYRQLTSSLETIGVKVIETEGKEFDPNLHNAVMHIDDEAFGENMIAEEFQKGYTYRDTVIRHSMVKVAN